MKLTDYNPGEKQMSWTEMMRKKKKLAAMHPEGEMGKKPWHCKGCGKSSFTLKAARGLLLRKCKHCDDVVSF